MAGFVTRSGSQLQLNSAPFRLFGVNMFWLGLTDAESSNPSYPYFAQIDDALQTAKEMGCNAVRAHTLGVSTGYSLSVWPTLNSTNTTAFNTIDYSIYRAGLLGLRLIIPLTDNHYYYHGGLHNFTDWRNITDPSQFYTNTTVIADFEAYISVILNRVNQYNSVAYKNDPTILCWETGNEVTPPTSWTTTIANYIKGIDANHLVMDGNQGVPGADLSAASVDIVTTHMYPPYVSLLQSDSATSSGSSKVYIVGEFDWKTKANSTGSVILDTSTFHSGAQSAKVAITVSSSDNYQINLRQTRSNFGLVTGTTYTFSFYAQSDMARQIQANIQSTNSPYTIYNSVVGSTQYFNLTTSWAQYSTTFTVPANDNNIFINLCVGAYVSNVWFDDVFVGIANGTNLVNNPGFESALTTNDWQLSLISGNNDLDTFLPAIEQNTNVSGALAWAMMPHGHVNGFDPYVDHFPIYYPIGQITALNQDTDQPNRMQLMRTHGFKMQGLTPAPAAIIPVAPIPTITSSAGVNSVVWAGVVGARDYILERAATVNGPWTVVGTYTDFQTPVSDTAASTTVYRLHAENVDGKAGAYSNNPPPGGTMPVNLLPVDTNGKQAGSGYDPLSHATVSNQIVNVQTDNANNSTQYGVPAEAPFLLNNTTNVAEQQHSVNGEYDSKGIGIPLNVSGLYNGGAPGTIYYDRVRSIQSKYTQTATISSSPSIGATSAVFSNIGGLTPGQPILLTGGTNEVVYVSTSWSASTTVTFQSPVAQANHTGCTYETYNYSGPANNAVQPFGIQAVTPTIFDPNFYNYYVPGSFTQDGRAGQTIQTSGTMIFNGTNNDRALGLNGAQDVNVGGRHATGVAAGASGAVLIKTGAGRLSRIIVTVTGTAPMFFYDATSATGLIIAALPASATIGPYDFNMPCTSGIFAGGAANTPGVTVSWT